MASGRCAFRAKAVAKLLGRPDLDTNEIRELAGGKDRVRPEGGRGGGVLLYNGFDINVIHEALDPAFFAARSEVRRPAVIATRMTKGGVGKTSLTVNIAVVLALQGYRVLLVDLDQQGNATELLGIDPEDDVEHTFASVVLEDVPLQDALLTPYEDLSLSLLPADQTLSEFDVNVASKMSRESMLNEMLNESYRDFVYANFDVVLIDTGPGSGFLTFNALVAADLVFVPMMLDGFSMKALRVIRSELSQIDRYLKLKKKLLFAANSLHLAHRHGKINLEFMSNAVGPSDMANTVLSHYVGYSRQIQLGGLTAGQSVAAPLILREALSAAADQLIALAAEVLESAGVRPLVANDVVVAGE